jgi:uncharacterized protein YndB with AHSA1/START domain
MTEYALEGAVEIGAAPEEILRWLEDPELLERWMGVGSIEPTGATDSPGANTSARSPTSSGRPPRTPWSSS